MQYLFNIDLICCIFQRFIFDYLSERINERNSQLSDLIYNSPWHLFRPKLRMRLLMILRQSQRDQYVLTAQWFPFSFETFSRIIQKIYSLYAVLRDFI